MATAAAAPLANNAYAVLGLMVGASPEDVKRAFRQKAIRTHPDKGGSHKTMILLGWAREILEDPARAALHFLALRPVPDGSRVVLRGLVRRPELNGSSGLAWTFDGQRVRVLLDTGTEVSVKPSCVILAPPPTSAWASWAPSGASAGASGPGAWARADWSEAGASAGGAVDPRVRCPGPSEGRAECPHWAWILPKRGRCRSCAAAAATTGPRVPPEDGLEYCPGVAETECPNWAQVRPGRQCCTCRAASSRRGYNQPG